MTRLVHVSALGASKDSPSAFLRTKAEGEEAIKAEFPDVTIVRPSSIFGPEDRFLSRIACKPSNLASPFLITVCLFTLFFFFFFLSWPQDLNMLPLFYGNPVVKGGQQILQPIYVSSTLFFFLLFFLFFFPGRSTSLSVRSLMLPRASLTSSRTLTPWARPLSLLGTPSFFSATVCAVIDGASLLYSPRKYTYEQLVKYFGEVAHRHVQVVPYPEFALK